MSAASYEMTEMIPSTSALMIDRSEDQEDAIFESAWVIKRSILSFPVYITKKMLIYNRLSCIALNDAAYGLPEEGWFRSMLFSVNTSRNPI